MKFDLLANATVVDDAMRFVTFHQSKENLKSSNSNECDKEESKQPDYDDKDRLEKEQEEEAGKTTVKVF
jgi:hypothetical protein